MNHSTAVPLFPAAAFLTGVAGASVLGGFGMTLGMAKKKDPNMFNKGIMGAREMHEAGGALALRALGWGSLYAIAGFSVFCFSVWKLSGAKDVSHHLESCNSICNVISFFLFFIFITYLSQPSEKIKLKLYVLNLEEAL